MRLVVDIANIIIAVCAIWLSYISSQEAISRWRGIKNISGQFAFSEKNILNLDSKLSNEPGFVVIIQNKGLAPQGLTTISDGGSNPIRILFNSKKTPGVMLNYGDLKMEFFKATPFLVDKLKKSNGLFVTNRLGKKKKIASKNKIKGVLEAYKKYLKKRGEL